MIAEVISVPSYDGPPIRKCMICDKYEKEVDEIFCAVHDWICPDCKIKLRRLMNETLD